MNYLLSAPSDELMDIVGRNDLMGRALRARKQEGFKPILFHSALENSGVLQSMIRSLLHSQLIFVGI
jgi:hypothetical protein